MKNEKDNALVKMLEVFKPKRWVNEPQGFSQKENFVVWKKIKLGTHESSKLLWEGVNTMDPGYKAICSWERFEVADKYAFEISKEEKEIQLVRVSLADLGFTDLGVMRDYSPYYPCMGEVINKAKERGLELCPFEAGLQLRLQYKDQPNGQYLKMVTESTLDYVNLIRRYAFNIESSFEAFVTYKLIVQLSFADDDEFISYEDERFIFCLPKK